jgi:putative ABC transport system ATP-binding protein
MKNEILRVEKLAKHYQMGEATVKALNGVDLTISRGDYLAIMGPSGSGKTTLLDILSGLLRPTMGEVIINGEPISEMEDRELAQLRGKTIGFVFQSFNLIPRMTAKENVMLPLWFQNIPIEERKKIAEKRLQDVGLADRMNHRPNELSGGQRQRVAIARALAVNPEVIVADEPTGNLDSESGNHIMGIIDELNQKQGKTIIMVTHEREIAEHAQYIIHLRDGKIVEQEMLKTKQKNALGVKKT